MSNEVSQAIAARALANHRTKAEAAREAGVHPSAITRWMKTPEFRDLILKAGEPAETVQDQAIQGLADLVPQALRTLKDALEGADISTQQQTVALNIIDKARKWESKVLEDEGPSTLAAAIAEIDAHRTG